jgi:lipopolysaccharide cholinephosphotransferase
MIITDAQLEQKKQNLKEILRYFVSFCDKHGLQYYCTFGTCLGMVRHKGFIPWDDDVDVAMPRPDYDRLLSMRDQLDADYELIDCETTPEYNATFAKISSRKSTIVEHEAYRFVMGNYVDIFPIDGCGEDEEEFRKDYEYTQYLRDALNAVSKHYGPWKFVKWLLRGKWSLFALHYKYSFQREEKRRHIISELRRIRQKYSFEEARFVTVWAMWFSYKRERIEKEAYGKGLMANLEDVRALIPSDYDRVLSRLYGNYMQLPPLEQQQSHHECFYINLEKRVSLEEALREGNRRTRAIGYKS